MVHSAETLVSPWEARPANDMATLYMDTSDIQLIARLPDLGSAQTFLDRITIAFARFGRAAQQDVAASRYGGSLKAIQCQSFDQTLPQLQHAEAELVSWIHSSDGKGADWRAKD